METLTELVAKITVDAKQLDTGLVSSAKSVDNWAKKHQKTFGMVGKSLIAFGGAITAAFGLSVKAAMEAVESENLFTVSLGKNADAARKWSQTLSKSLGLNSFELRKNVGVLFTMISSMGLAEGAALNMSQGIVELANDMASFYNLPTEEAFAKLRAGLTGETEPLKRLGILVDEATIKTVALTNGIIKEGEELTQTQKVQARYLAILAQTTAAQGDLARTIDSPTNKLRVLSSTFQELQITIGTHLIPTFSDLLTKVSNVTRAIKEWITVNPEMAKELVFSTAKLAGLAIGIGGILLLLPRVISLVASLITLFGPWGIAIAAVTLGLGLLVAQLLGLSDAMKTIKKGMKDVELQMFRLEVEQAHTAEQWAAITKQGYLTEQQFINLARAMKLTTAELHEKMRAAGMLDVVMTTLGDTNVYLRTTQDKVSEGTKEISADMAQAQAATEAYGETVDAVADKNKTLAEQWIDLINRIQFANSISGKLGLTFDDLATYIFETGGNLGKLRELFIKYEGSASAVDEILRELGLDAQTVAQAIEKMSSVTMTSIDSFVKQAESLTESEKSIESLTMALTEYEQAMMSAGLATGGMISGGKPSALFEEWAAYTTLPEFRDSSEARGVLDAIAEWQRRADAGEDVGSISPIALWVAALQQWASRVGWKLPGFESGGIVPGPLGMPQLAVVHGGETVLPDEGWIPSITINIDSFTANSERDVDNLAEKVVKLIRIRTGMR